MTTPGHNGIDLLRFRPRDYGLYGALAFAIWLTGVILVRLLGPTAFDTDEPWPTLLYLASIGLGVATQFVVALLVRLPVAETLVPIIVICGCALALDGLAIGFTDIYASDAQTKMVVGGWLLWTFGIQIIISLLIIGRAQRMAKVETT